MTDRAAVYYNRVLYKPRRPTEPHYVPQYRRDRPSTYYLAINRIRGLKVKRWSTTTTGRFGGSSIKEHSL